MRANDQTTFWPNRCSLLEIIFLAFFRWVPLPSGAEQRSFGDGCCRCCCCSCRCCSRCCESQKNARDIKCRRTEQSSFVCVLSFDTFQYILILPILFDAFSIFLKLSFNKKRISRSEGDEERNFRKLLFGENKIWRKKNLADELLAIEATFARI